MKVNKLNDLLAERLGRNPHGGPLYKWVQAHELRHYRYLGDDWKVISLETGLLAPTPQFKDVPAYPQAGRRWVFAGWQHLDQAEHERVFGNRVPFRRRGIYVPVLIMREGKVPNRDITEFFIQQVQFERAKTAADEEAEIDKLFAREDRSAWNHIYSVIDDATTAFGADPGKKGSTSFPSPQLRTV